MHLPELLHTSVLSIARAHPSHKYWFLHPWFSTSPVLPNSFKRETLWLFFLPLQVTLTLHVLTAFLKNMIFTWTQWPYSSNVPIASLCSNGEWESDISSMTKTCHHSVSHPEGFWESVSHTSIAIYIYDTLCFLERVQQRKSHCWLREVINMRLRTGEAERAKLFY